MFKNKAIDEIRQAFADCKKDIDDCLVRLQQAIELTEDCLIICGKWVDTDVAKNL